MPNTFDALTPQQQRCATVIVRGLYYTPVAVPRIEAIFRVVASARPMIDIGSLRFSGLSRKERKLAASVIWAAYIALEDDRRSEELLQFLGSSFAVT